MTRVKALPFALGALLLALAALTSGRDLLATRHSARAEAALPVSAAATDFATPPRVAAAVAPKMDAALAAVGARHSAAGILGARMAAADAGLPLLGDRARVVLEAHPGQAARARADLETVGGRVEAAADTRLQASIPVSALDALAGSAAVRRLSLPTAPTSQATTSQGKSVVGAHEWHAAGFKGAGVRIGVLDVGFDGYERLLGQELPARVVARSFRADGDINALELPAGTRQHGTAVAEIIHDLAPDAELYLVNSSTEVEFVSAIDWLISQRVHVVNASVGFLCFGRLDGSGPENDAVARARAAGVLWVNAAGNSADRHWSGTFADGDNDGWHDFAPSDEGNRLHLTAGQAVRVCVSWDDWEARDQDYDLYLKDESGQTVASSLETQTGDALPREQLEFFAPADGSFDLAISRQQASRPAVFHMHVTVAGTGGCAATVAVEGSPTAPRTLGDLRTLRDERLMQSRIGRDLAGAFYAASPEVARVLVLRPELRARASALLGDTAPMVRALNGEGAGPVITAELVARAEELLDEFAAHASPSLRDTLLEGRRRLALANAVGLTAPAHWARLTAGEMSAQSHEPGHLEHATSASSLVIPADSANALTVGATHWSTDQIEPYSSRGPTADGRVSRT